MSKKELRSSGERWKRGFANGAVTTVRGNSLKGYVSIDSPLGKAILGHKVGDRVTVKVSDAYSYDLIIKSIENTADTDDELRSY